MKKTKHYILLSLVFICSLTSAFAQNYDLINLLPPAPNAAALGKYAGVSTGLSSGAVNFSIPLLNYTSKDISIPISLNYTSNGFKIDEIASRVGNQWSLNAGGVITRTILGSPDEKSARIQPLPPLGDNNGYELFQFEAQLSNPDALAGVGPTGAVDGQPDMFSFNFNGYNGKFILDTLAGSNQPTVPVMLSNSGLKIEIIGVSLSEFKITTPEGEQYYLGGSAKETTTAIGCSVPYSNNTTSWYLEKIVHPNGDIVNFYYSPLTYDYSTGISQTIYVFTGAQAILYCGNDPVNRPQPTNTSCTNQLETHGVLLDSITSTHGDKVKFTYIDRDDDNDKLVSTISVYGPDHTTLYKTFNLTYATSHSRSFLISLSEKNSANTVIKKHSFGYNDKETVPAALSFSQDYWGYYNGKTNTTNIPKPKDPDFAQTLALATANRDPDPVYAAKGLLNSITYPTGGKDTVSYEGNQAYQTSTIYPNQQVLSFPAANNTGSGSTLTFTSTATAVISTRQQVTFYGDCATSSSTPNSSRTSTIEILDASNVVVDNISITPGHNSSKTLILSPGTYKLGIILYGDYVSAHANLSYYAGNPTTGPMNTAIGGVRVSQIATYDGISSTPIIKKYNYNKLLSPTQSSAATTSTPYYERTINMWVPCTAGGTCTDARSFQFTISSSNAALNLFKTSTPATYLNVTESFGNNFENGGVEHEFTGSQDNDATIFRGARIVGAPSGNESYRNGYETYQGVFKVISGNRIYVKKVDTHYDGLYPPYVKQPGFDTAYEGYVATENYHLVCTPPLGSAATSYEKQNYNTSYYFIHKAWIYADTVKTTNYDSNGSSYVQTTQAFDYNNVDNAKPTAITTYASNGDVLKTTLTYPTDYTSSIYTTMTSKHIISPVIIKTDFNGAIALQSIKTNFYDWGNNIYAPQTVQTQMGTAGYETRLHFYGYDDQGNVLSVAKEGGPKVNYVWGYTGRFPIAKIENAEYSDVSSVLGGSTAIKSFRNNADPTDTQVNTFLAHLRTDASLSKAMVTTNTFDPILGVTSTTDPKGQTTTYEYDTFQRLMNIKDEDGNITKHYGYHYGTN